MKPEIKEEIKQENDHFFIACQSDGFLGKEGLATNFSKNPVLKEAEKATINNGATTNTTGFTRDADIIEIHPEILRSLKKEDFEAVKKLLSNQDVNRFRRKKIKYGNNNALQEIIAQKVCSLTGMNSPNTKMMVSESEFRENGVLEVSVLSPMIVGYKDLGDFLIYKEAADRFIPKEKMAEWKIKAKQIEEINLLEEKASRKAGSTEENEDIIDGQTKLRRVKLMSEIYQMFPQYFRDEIEKSYAASKLVNNWDFANFNLKNIGCTFSLNEKDEIVSFGSVFVDFGNSGLLGFKGKYKNLSYKSANIEAKPKKDKSNRSNFDPALELTEEEHQFLEARVFQIMEDASFQENLVRIAKNNLKHKISGFENEENLINKEVKLIANKIAYDKAITSLQETLINSEQEQSKQEINLIKSIIFKTAHHIREESAQLEIDKVTSGFLTISDIPRNLPFSFILEDAIKAKTSSIVNDSLNYRDSEIEMAFRMSLIPDQAIEMICEKWDMSKKFPQIFALNEEQKVDNLQSYQEEKLAQIFINRKNYLVASIPKEVIDKWICNNIIKATCAENSVRNSVTEQTDNLCKIIAENSIAKRIESVDLQSQTTEKQIKQFVLAKSIIKEIEEKSAELKEKYSSHRENEFLEKKRLLIETEKSATTLLESIQNNQQLKSKLESVLNNTNEVKEKLSLEVDKLNNQIQKEIKQKVSKSMMKFVKENYQNWNQKLSNKDPSYNLINLKDILKNNILQNNEVYQSNDSQYLEEELSLSSLTDSKDSSILNQDIENSGVEIDKAIIKMLNVISSVIINKPKTSTTDTEATNINTINKVKSFTI